MTPIYHSTPFHKTLTVHEDGRHIVFAPKYSFVHLFAAIPQGSHLSGSVVFTLADGDPGVFNLEDLCERMWKQDGVVFDALREFAQTSRDVTPEHRTLRDRCFMAVIKELRPTTALFEPLRVVAVCAGTITRSTVIHFFGVLDTPVVC